MLNLTSTSDKIQVVTASALTTDMHASYLEVDGSTNPQTVTPKSAEALAIGAATTDLVPAPGVTTKQHACKTLNIRNTHASSSNTITVQKVNGAGTAQLQKIVLLAGETLQWISGEGWRVLDATGSLKTVLTAVGRYLRTLVVNAGTTTATASNDANKWFVRLFGAGGGGGSVSSVATASGGAGGGAAGGYLEKTIAVVPGTGYACVVGAKGTGATAGANNGNAGADSTLTIGATTYTAKGGPGGIGAASVNGVSINLGGNIPAVSTNGDVNGCGGAGGVGIGVSNALAVSGKGGDSQLGAGGSPVKTTSAGVAAIGFGAGGGGSCSISAGAAAAGGNGADGILLIDEYSA